MPICDGKDALDYDCSADIPWRMTTTGLEHGNRYRSTEYSDLVRFNTAEFMRSLKKVVTTEYGGCRPGVDPGNRDPKFVTLCKKCWGIKAATWGDADYSGVRAKTNNTGCYFNASVYDAFQKNGSPYIEAILSCACHELMHFWSFESKGLQPVAHAMSVWWDEVAADLLGYLTYKDYFRGRFKKYVTPYSQYPRCIELCGQQILNMPQFKWNQWKNGPANPHRPNELNELFSATRFPLNQMSDQMLKSRLSRSVQELIFESLVTWFFRGTAAVVQSLAPVGTCAEFITNERIREIINPATAFPGFGGGADTEHEFTAGQQP